MRLTLRDQLLLMGTIATVTAAAGMWAFTVQRDIADLKKDVQRMGIRQEWIVEALGVRHLGPPEPAQP